MTALTRHSGTGLRLSRSLTEAMAVSPWMRVPGNEGMNGLVIVAASPRLSSQTIQEAQSALPAVLSLLSPLPQALLQEACDMIISDICAAIAQTPDESTRKIRTIALVMACRDMPRCAFSLEASAECMRRLKWFPSVAEIIGVLEDAAAPVRRQEAALRRVASSKPYKAPPPRKRPSEDEKRAVAAMMEKVRGDKARNAEREAAEREWGQWVPEGAEGLSGDKLNSALEAVAPSLSGWQRTIIDERIADWSRRRAFISALEERP